MSHRIKYSYGNDDIAVRACQEAAAPTEIQAAILSGLPI
jgi:hypothetical protein